MEAQAVDISSLITKPETYGATCIGQEVLRKLESVSKIPLSHMLTRGVFNAHVGFDSAVEHAASGKPLYIYIPVSASDRLTHLRHVLFFKFACYLQQALDCYVFVHVNEHKAFCKDESNSKYDCAVKWAEETIKDVLSFDFIPSKTIVLTNQAAVSLNYVMLCDLQRKTALGSFTDSFFSDDTVNVGTMDAMFQEGACSIPSYVQKIFPDPDNTRCLMLLRQTQGKLFEFSTSLAKLVSQPTPFAIFGGFVPAPQNGQKMPKIARFALGAAPTGGPAEGEKKGGKQKNEVRDYMTIYIKNTSKEIITKVNKFAYSGGKDTLTEQREKGANISVDIPLFYLKLFLESETEYQKVIQYYGPGDLPEGNESRMASGNIKKQCGELLASIIKGIQDKRSKVTKEMIQNAYKIRSL